MPSQVFEASRLQIFKVSIQYLRFRGPLSRTSRLRYSGLADSGILGLPTLVYEAYTSRAHLSFAVFSSCTLQVCILPLPIARIGCPQGSKRAFESIGITGYPLLTQTVESILGVDTTKRLHGLQSAVSSFKCHMQVVF